MKLIYLFILLFLSTSCVETNSKTQPNGQSEFTVVPITDSLKFTSGILAIFEDSRGNYWFGSAREGVCLYDGKSLTYYTTEEGLSDNQVRSIQESDDGRIWFGTQNGVSRFDGTRMTNLTKNIFTNFSNKWMKADGDLWFNAGTKEGVYRYDGQTLSYLDFPAPKRVNSNNVYSVTDISKGKNNMLWMGTYAGVIGYDGRDFTIINDESLGFDVLSAPLHIRSVLEDSKGRLWIGNNGIGVLLKEGDSIINFSEMHNLIHPMSSRRGDKSPPGTLEHVFTITEDSRGNIWFGDRDAGIWKYDGKKMKNYTRKNGLANDFALAIYEDKKGVLWFGMADGTVYTYNDEAFEQQF